MANRRWPTFDNHDVIITSYDVITPHCGPQRRHLYSKSYCHSFYTCEVMEAPEDKKIPLVGNRVRRAMSRGGGDEVSTNRHQMNGASAGANRIHL